MDRRMDRRTVAKGAGVLAGVAAIGGLPAVAEGTTTPAEASLYERLGGYFAIAAVVNRFSDEIIKNPKLNENPALKEWNETQAESRLPGLKFGRTLWVAVGGRRTLRVHRIATQRGSCRTQPQRRGVRRGRRRDRPGPRLLWRPATRTAGVGRGLQRQHDRRRHRNRIGDSRAFRLRERAGRVTGVAPQDPAVSSASICSSAA